MAKVKKATTYKHLKRPYTRISKFRTKSFIRARPVSKVVSYDMGACNKKFSYRYVLASKKDCNIRHNAIESGRQSSNRVLEQTLGKRGYHMKIVMYPHHVLRENPLAAGAGADRMSTGMKMSFGKPVSVAARIKKGQRLVVLRVGRTGIDIGKNAMKRFMHKMPCSCTISLEQVKEPVKASA